MDNTLITKYVAITRGSIDLHWPCTAFCTVRPFLEIKNRPFHRNPASKKDSFIEDALPLGLASRVTGRKARSGKIGNAAMQNR